jgi:hypothetical protein
MFFYLPDPDPLVRGPDPGILPFSHKGVERTEINSNNGFKIEF